MVFPSNWPEQCPPSDSEPANGEAYRLVKANPWSAADFSTHHELGTLPKAPPCLRCGLSVFRTLEDVEHQQRAYPRLGRFVTMGTLQAGHGRTKRTPGRQPTHTTWWVFEGVDRQAIFAIVKELS